MVCNRFFAKFVEFAGLRVSFDGRIEATGSEVTEPRTQTRHDVAKGHLRPFPSPAAVRR